MESRQFIWIQTPHNILYCKYNTNRVSTFPSLIFSVSSPFRDSKFTILCLTYLNRVLINGRYTVSNTNTTLILMTPKLTILLNKSSKLNIPIFTASIRNNEKKVNSILTLFWPFCLSPYPSHITPPRISFITIWEFWHIRFDFVTPRLIIAFH